MNLGELAKDSPQFKRFEDTVREIHKEINENKNKGDIKVVRLDQMLQEIFNKLSISSLDELDEITDELIEALKQARDINRENDRLSETYNGHFAFVKSYKDAIEAFPDISNKDIEKFFVIVFKDIEERLAYDTLIVQGRKNFIDTIKKDITKVLLKEKLYPIVKPYYEYWLGELYTNIQLFK